MNLEDATRFEYSIIGKDGKVLDSFVGDVLPLKYGELMGNRAAHAVGEKRVFKLLNDKPVGFVNHMDVLAAARFMLTTGGTGIFKHTGVCGAAYGFPSRSEEYSAASDVDDVARFGGIIGTPKVTVNSAIKMVGKTGKKKQDAVVSLKYEDGAVDALLKGEKPPLVFQLLDEKFDIPAVDIQTGLDGAILQERIPPLQRSDLKVSTGNYAITDRVLDDVIFGFKVADTRHSNAIVLVERTEKGTIAVGIGAGDSDRITAAYQAMEKAVSYYLLQYLKVPRKEIPTSIDIILYKASDGFFPDFRALEVATPKVIENVKNRIARFPYATQGEMQAGKSKKLRTLLADEKWDIPAKFQYIADRLRIKVPLVLNPGGSKGDDTVTQYAKANNMTMLITERDGKHLRCFKHGPQSAYRVR